MGIKVGYVMCGECQKHMSYCNCEGGVKAPSQIVKALDKLVKIQQNWTPMTLVSSFSTHPAKANTLDNKYVKTTYEALSNSNTNLENIAVQIGQLPVREQKKFFRLLLNYVDITAYKGRNYKNTMPTMREVIELSERIMDLVNEYYEEQELNQLAFEGM